MPNARNNGARRASICGSGAKCKGYRGGVSARPLLRQSAAQEGDPQSREGEVGPPSGGPCRQPAPFSNGEEDGVDSVEGKRRADGRPHSQQRSPARGADGQARGQEDDDEAGEGEGQFRMQVHLELARAFPAPAPQPGDGGFQFPKRHGVRLPFRFQEDFRRLGALHHLAFKSRRPSQGAPVRPEAQHGALEEAPPLLGPLGAWGGDLPAQLQVRPMLQDDHVFQRVGVGIEGFRVQEGVLLPGDGQQFDRPLSPRGFGRVGGLLKVVGLEGVDAQGRLRHQPLVCNEHPTAGEQSDREDRAQDAPGAYPGGAHGGQLLVAVEIPDDVQRRGKARKGHDLHDDDGEHRPVVQGDEARGHAESENLVEMSEEVGHEIQGDKDGHAPHKGADRLPRRVAVEDGHVRNASGAEEALARTRSAGR